MLDFHGMAGEELAKGVDEVGMGEVLGEVGEMCWEDILVGGRLCSCVLDCITTGSAWADY